MASGASGSGRWGLATAIALLALWAHGAVLTTLPLVDDEGATLLERTFAALISDQEALNHPPPFRLVVMAALRLSDDLPLLRLLSALPASVAAGWLAWIVAAAAPGAAGLAGGLAAGLGLALTPWLLLDTSTLRPYGLTLLAAVGLVAALSRTMVQPDRDGLRWLAAAGVAAAWTHFALLPWSALAAIALWRVGTAPMVGPAPPIAPALQPRDRVTPLLALALGTAPPLGQAALGALAKAGGASQSMTPWQDLDLFSMPEPALAAALLATARLRDDRRAVAALRAIGGLAVPMLLGLVLASTLLRTLRWTHVAVLVPALWAGIGATIAAIGAPRAAGGTIGPADAGRSPPLPPALGPTPRAALLALGVAAWLGFGLADAWSQWSDEPRLDDITLLAAALDGTTADLATGDARPLALGPGSNVAVWFVGPDRLRSGAQVLLGARGLYRDGPDRCVGADVIHSERCRRRARRLGGQPGCVGLCDARVCLWPATDAPVPWDVAEDESGHDPDACRPTALGRVATALLPTGTLRTAPAEAVISAAGLVPAAYVARRLGRWWWLEPRR